MKDRKQLEVQVKMLLFSGQEANVRLAVQLAEGQNIELIEYLEIAKLARARGRNTEEILLDFFNKGLVSLERRGLQSIPNWLFEHPKASSYYLGGNKLSALPDCIPKLKLDDFCVEQNQLKDLPASFANLEVEYVDLSDNQFEDVPEALLKVKGLETLEMGGNQLETINGKISLLEDLEELYLSRNVLKELPISLLDLKYLRKLDLSYNELNYYPLVLEPLIEGSLKSLNLSRNKLDHFPKYIAKMAHSLELAVFRDNPISDELKAALAAEAFFQNHSIGWELLDEKDFYEEL